MVIGGVKFAVRVMVVALGSSRKVGGTCWGCGEVKGKATESPVELTENETATAAKSGDDYYLYVVCPNS